MYHYAQPLQTLIDEFSKMPGIGKKNAQRLAYYVLSLNDMEAVALAQAVIDVKEKIHLCPQCFNFTDDELCDICRADARDRNTLCVVSTPRDIASIERAREYKGSYHVLHGVISPMDGIGPDALKIKELLSRIAQQEISEVIIATNPNVEGEATALYLSRLIKPLGVKVTRLAKGVPVGGDLEFADEYTLISAIEGRQEM